MKERDGKYTVDGLLRSVLKMVTVMVVVSQKGAGIFDTVHTVTPKTLSILTSMVVRCAHHQTPWESHLALVELKVEYTLGYKIAPLVM